MWNKTGLVSIIVILSGLRNEIGYLNGVKSLYKIHIWLLFKRLQAKTTGSEKLQLVSVYVPVNSRSISSSTFEW